MHDVLFSSKRDDWETPPQLFQELDREFGFTLDACAAPHNKKCSRYFSPEDDALSQDWQSHTVWCNPPYGRDVTGRWIEKAHQSALAGATVVCLVPARTDTRWFHQYVLGQAEIRFLKGRVRFVGASSGAPFPSMIVIFRPLITNQRSSSVGGSHSRHK